MEHHRPMYSLWIMCRLLKVSKSGYEAWRYRPRSARDDEDARLTTSLRVIYAESKQRYGSPRAHPALRQQGHLVGRTRVERLMREAGIPVKVKARFVAPTDSNHDQPIADNVLLQDFTAPAPDTRWVTDLTDIQTKEGWLYLAAIMELFSRRIVGWAMSERIDRHLVLKALAMAVAQRKPAPGLLHHSDRGSPYASADYRDALKSHEMRASMSRRACCYDNAAMEIFWHSLKVKVTYRTTYETRDQATMDIFNFMEVFYNRTCLHSTIGYVSPVDFEQQHSAVA